MKELEIYKELLESISNIPERIIPNVDKLDFIKARIYDCQNKINKLKPHEMVKHYMLIEPR